MNGLGQARKLRSGPVGLALSAAVAIVAVVAIVATVDGDVLARTARRAAGDPGSVAVAMAAFATAFLLRAIAWRRVLPGLGFGQALSGIHVALGANHVLPLRLGEPLRIVSATRRAGVSAEAATASTVTLRAADVLAMVVVGIVASPAVFLELFGPFGWLLLATVVVVAAYSWRWLARIATGSSDAGEIRLPGFGTFVLAASAWGAEAVVVWQAAHWVGIELAWSEALLITTVAVAAQIAAIAPGGFGTYEAAAVAAYVALGHDAETALVAALAAHALKTVYSMLAGGIAAFLPAPGLFGRLRITPSVRSDDPDIDADPDTGADTGTGADTVLATDGPVLLFMPAFNEEASVGACVARVPSEVLGRPVHVLVIDDGSTDDTKERAQAAGAEVLSLVGNRGLGAAVRTGLAEGVAREAAAVAFCDADGEYHPEEIAALVGPILDGEADYVTGSRFLGRIDHMRPHRRFGNVVLTSVLSVIARRRITDGQTGYRAFSPRTARSAEIIHDFNYAQVLTLDLLAKGFRLVEVPISYRFRQEGESFIKLGPYLRNVLPAVYRELNAG